MTQGRREGKAGHSPEQLGSTIQIKVGPSQGSPKKELRPGALRAQRWFNKPRFSALRGWKDPWAQEEQHFSSHIMGQIITTDRQVRKAIPVEIISTQQHVATCLATILERLEQPSIKTALLREQKLAGCEPCNPSTTTCKICKKNRHKSQ